MKPIGAVDIRLAGSSAISGPMEAQKALAAIILWSSGNFDTYDLGQVLDVPEDAVCRTLHAARDVGRGRG